MASTTLRTSEHANLRCRVSGEFLEMPGLCLTLPQAARLWGLDLETTADLLHDLVDASFLQVRGAQDHRSDCGRRAV